MVTVEEASIGASSDSQGQADLSLITSRLRELEEEHAEPERREALRRRKKQLREAGAFAEDKGRSSEDKVAFLLQRLQQQGAEQGKLEQELFPLRTQLHKAKAESAKKAALADRLQDLCRSLQAQNRAVKEEDAAKRKQMLDSFQASIEDIKSKVDSSAALSAESLAERKALQEQLANTLDLQGVLEQHYTAKVREMQVRLELAQAKQRQAELAAGEQRAKADEVGASYKQATALLSDMADKYKQLEAGMDENAQMFKRMAGESAQHLELTRKLEAQLGAREREAARLKQDVAAANAKLIELSAENHALKGQALKAQAPCAKRPAQEAGEAVEKLRAQNTTLQSLARTLQAEVRALKCRAGLDDAEEGPAVGQGAGGGQGPKSPAVEVELPVGQGMQQGEAACARSPAFEVAEPAEQGEAAARMQAAQSGQDALAVGGV